MNLKEAILKLAWMPDELCLVAKRPWTPSSECEAVQFTPDYRIPEEIKEQGYEYFLEVSIAKEEVLAHAAGLLTPVQRVDAVIYYAEHDATPAWLNEICRG